MIARRWRAWTTPELADEMEPYLNRTGIARALETPGNRGALLMRGPGSANGVEFVVMTFWDSLDAIRAFAGDNYEQAVLFPEDHDYITRYDVRVRHLEVVGQTGVFPDLGDDADDVIDD